jgi:TIR domain
MADIFLSYSRKDSPRARQVADALTLAGWDVWWDVNLTAGEKFRHEIQNQLNASKCVVVLWSRDSVQSDFVIDEAEEGKRRGILVQAIVDDVQPPFGFGGAQWANLIAFTGDDDSPGLTDLMAGIARHVTVARKSPTTAARRARPNAQKKSATRSQVMVSQVERGEMGVADGVPREITNSASVAHVKRTQPSALTRAKALMLVILTIVIEVGLMVWLIPRSAPPYVFYIAFAVAFVIVLGVAANLGRRFER